MHGSIKKQFFFFPLKIRNRLVLFLILTFISHSYPEKNVFKGAELKIFHLLLLSSIPNLPTVIGDSVSTRIEKMRVMHKHFSLRGFFFFLLTSLKKDTKMKWKWMNEKEEEIFKKLSIVHHLGYLFLLFLFHSLVILPSIVWVSVI